MKKVLVITYYWPPSGGAGVQRWLKLSKYLVDLGVEVHILTVDPEYASYMAIDNSLEKDIHPKVIVHRTKSFEIINQYAKLFGKKKVPTAGFSNVDNNKFSQKIINFIRSNFFIPDPRIGWKKYAVKKGLEIINKHHITTIITTSPPPSTQIIGRTLKRKTGINWIVDFRDPWTDIYYYKLLNHSFISKAIDRNIEKSVIEECDKIITVSYGFKELFIVKSDLVNDEKFSIIPNGFDDLDFEHSDKTTKSTQKEFLICYTGTMSIQYDPFVFFNALENVASSNQLESIRLRFVGKVDKKIKTQLQSKSFKVEYIDTVPHSEINTYQKQADLLLLVIPNIEGSKGITPGKLFEYLATENKILALGSPESDVNRIIQECQAGNTFERDQEENITAFIKERIKNKFENSEPKINTDALKKYSRIEQAKRVAELL